MFLPEEVSHMAVPAILDVLHLRNTAEFWADSAESRNGRRMPHNSGLIRNRIKPANLSAGLPETLGATSTAESHE